MHRFTVAAAALAVVLAGARAGRAQPVTAALDYGPHRVGFRLITERDHSRAAQPRDTFDRTPVPADGALPMSLGIWYPAAANSTGTPMTAAHYRSVHAAADPAQAAAAFARQANRAGLPLSPEQASESVTRATRAVRDAAAAPGSFPLIVAGGFFAGPWILNEYLASHGYVVVMAAAEGRTATLQSTRPDLALETHVRNLEDATALAHRERLGDPARLGVIGVNFDGMAAGIYAMRGMRADAVVSVDGWESKSGTLATLLESPDFDPVRMRMPYMVFVQDERTPPARLRPDMRVFDTFLYSTRYWYEIKGLDHLHLISDLAQASTLTPDLQHGHRFVHTTIRRFLDAYVKGDPAARAALETGPPDDGLPATLKKTARREPAHPLPQRPPSSAVFCWPMQGASEARATFRRASCRARIQRRQNNAMHPGRNVAVHSTQARGRSGFFGDTSTQLEAIIWNAAIETIAAATPNATDASGLIPSPRIAATTQNAAQNPSHASTSAAVPIVGVNPK